MKPLTYREDLNVKGHGRAWMTSATDRSRWFRSLVMTQFVLTDLIE